MDQHSIRRQIESVKRLSWSDGPDVAEWLRGAENASRFLIENARSDAIVLYATSDSVFVHGVLASIEQIERANPAELRRAWWDPSDAWKIQKSYGGGEEYRVYLEPPMSHPGADALRGSEKLIFRRHLDGMKDFQIKTEVSQKLVHTLGAFWFEERHAYSRLNDEGDIEDVVYVYESGDLDREICIVVLIDAKCVAEYMALTNTCLFRKFDFTRIIGESFSDWGEIQRFKHAGHDLVYDGGISSSGSFVAGYHIARTQLSIDQLVEVWKESLDESEKQYETFIAQDWRHGSIIEASCAPEKLANYFTAVEGLPFQTTPAFFKPEVLQRYKADPDKYEIRDRSISCRNAWYLKSFDVNEAGQIHVYLCDLAKLPIKEQRYWKVFNEEPRAPISKRAFETDFEGSWSTQYDPLQEVIRIIKEVEGDNAEWWNARPEEVKRKIHYPLTSSAADWANELLHLDQLIVEGFSLVGLRRLASKIGCKFESQWQTMRMLETICEIGQGSLESQKLVKPFRDLHHLRSKTKGHATGEAKRLHDQAILECGSLPAHFRTLAGQCEVSLQRVAAILAELAQR